MIIFWISVGVVVACVLFLVGLEVFLAREFGRNCRREM